jgi:hypothetical protein
VQKGDFISFFERKLHFSREKFENSSAPLKNDLQANESACDQVLCDPFLLENLRGHHSLDYGVQTLQILLSATVFQEFYLFFRNNDSVI